MRDIQARAEKVALEAKIDPEGTGCAIHGRGVQRCHTGCEARFVTGRRGGRKAEIALAHKVGSEVERAYRRGDMVEKRRAMMTD